MVFSPDGERIASGSIDTVWIWDVNTGILLAQLDGSMGRVWSVSFSRNGERVASGSDDNTVRIWDATSGNQVAQFNGHTDRVWSVAFSPDDTHIVSGGNDGTVEHVSHPLGIKFTHPLSHFFDDMNRDIPFKTIVVRGIPILFFKAGGVLFDGRNWG